MIGVTQNQSSLGLLIDSNFTSSYFTVARRIAQSILFICPVQNSFQRLKNINCGKEDTRTKVLRHALSIPPLPEPFIATNINLTLYIRNGFHTVATFRHP
jgi:hypothetical protein